MDLAPIIAIFVHYFEELLGPQLFITNEVIRARHKFHDMHGYTVHDPLVMNWMRIS